MQRGVFPLANFLPVLLLLWAVSACDKEKPNPPAPPAEPPAVTQTPSASPVATASTPPPLGSSISFGSPVSDHQLAEGFFPIEFNAWRWTAKRFTVNLAVPAGAKSKGASLRFKFALPDAVFKQYKTLGMSATVGSEQLPAQQFTKSGEQEFVANVPATALQDVRVSITFSLNKTYEAGGTDARALGVIAKSIALEAK
jgi:hypothetical protein